jgi:hypothetical protein
MNKMNLKIGWIILGLLLTACDLEVSMIGSGYGAVLTAQGDVQCETASGTCTVSFNRPETMTLQAHAEVGSRFVGWGGACSGHESTCSIRMNNNKRVVALFESIHEEPGFQDCDEESALAQCLEPTQTDSYYVDQGEKYFFTMESTVSPLVVPNYSEQVVRWEWEPWLLLTGFGEANMIWTDILLKLYPTKYEMMDCRAFETQPFVRCHVVFDYSGHFCPIYEEFTFNDQGEITFIEAWTDHDGLLPVNDSSDYWAEGESVRRLSTKLPGLGNTTGAINLYADWMEEAAIRDADVADFLERARKPYRAYFTELYNHSDDVRQGCEAPGASIQH